MNSFPEIIYFKDASKKRKKEEISDRLNPSLIPSSEKKNLSRKENTQIILEKVSPILYNDWETRLCNNSLQLNVILKSIINIHLLNT